jgi:hypothetical protein
MGTQVMLIAAGPDKSRVSRALLTQPEFTALVVFAIALMAVPLSLCTDKVPEQPSVGAL